MSIIAMSDLDLAGQRVLIREDLNVPIKEGDITSDARLQAALPTLQQALAAGAKVMVMSHLGRPTEGEFDPAFSMQPVAHYLEHALQVPVRLVTNYLDGVDAKAGEVLLFENVRFNLGEKKDDEALAKKLAALCDIYVMDAFGTAHRAQASTHGVAKYAKVACAGPLLQAELAALARALSTPQRPLLAIVGGSKVSTKLTVLEALADKVDQLIVGGGIANTFLAAAGYPVGKSLYEADLLQSAKALMDKVKVPLPIDVVCAKTFAETAEAATKLVADVAEDDLILDVGPQTSALFAQMITQAGTIIWNGPVGVFEFEAFGAGTQAVSAAVAESAGFSIAGGGDTLAAVDKYQIADKVSYISTGGGAFLEFVEGRTLPAVAALEASERRVIAVKS